MAPKCSQLTAIFVHLHMKACGMNRRGGRGVGKPMEPAESMVSMLMGGIIRNQAY